MLELENWEILKNNICWIFAIYASILRTIYYTFFSAILDRHLYKYLQQVFQIVLLGLKL